MSIVTHGNSDTREIGTFRILGAGRLALSSSLGFVGFGKSGEHGSGGDGVFGQKN